MSTVSELKSLQDVLLRAGRMRIAEVVVLPEFTQALAHAIHSIEDTNRWREWLCFVFTDNSTETQALPDDELKALVADDWGKKINSQIERADRLEAALRMTRTRDEHRQNCRFGEGCTVCDILQREAVRMRCEALGDEKNDGKYFIAFDNLANTKSFS